MMILDTNVALSLWKKEDRPVIQLWLNLQAIESVWLIDIVIAKLRVGVLGWEAASRRE